MVRKLLPRNRIFVSNRIQGQLTLRLGLYWVMYHFVLWHALFVYHFLQHRMSDSYQAVSFRELYGTFVLQYSPIIVCSIGMLPIFLIDLVRLSHRIAGPLVRFKAVLHGMTASEEVRPIRLRKGDLMTELEVAFNDYIAVYERHRLSQTTAFRMSESEAALVADVTSPERRSTADSPAAV